MHWISNGRCLISDKLCTFTSQTFLCDFHPLLAPRQLEPSRLAVSVKYPNADVFVRKQGSKLGLMVYWCLHDQAPRYLADHLIPASDAAPRRLHLRSANPNRLTVPRCRLSTCSCPAFYHAGPTVWNSAQDQFRNSDSSDGFNPLTPIVAIWV